MKSTRCSMLCLTLPGKWLPLKQRRTSCAIGQDLSLSIHSTLEKSKWCYMDRLLCNKNPKPDKLVAYKRASVTIFFLCSFLVIIVPLHLSIFPSNLNFHLFHMHSIAVHTAHDLMHSHAVHSQPHLSPQSCCLHIASCTVLYTATFLSI